MASRTPSTCSNAYSMHQKQPPAKVATARPAGGGPAGWVMPSGPPGGSSAGMGGSGCVVAAGAAAVLPAPIAGEAVVPELAACMAGEGDSARACVPPQPAAPQPPST